MIQQAQEEGNRKPLKISNVVVSDDIFFHILSFLPHADHVLRISLVSKAWLSLCRSQSNWHTLDSEHGLIYKSGSVVNMDQFLELLKRPQFAGLTSLAAPDRVKMRKGALERISQFCPKLHAIDLGYSLWSHMHVNDEALCKLPSLFPHLSKVKFGTDALTHRGICRFIEMMGDRLKNIRIYQCYSSTSSYNIDDKILETMARSCPNLEHFQVDQSHLHEAVAQFGRLTIEGFRRFFGSCQELKTIVLIGADNMALETEVFGQVIANYVRKRGTPLFKLVITSSTLPHLASIATILAGKVKHIRMMPNEDYCQLMQLARQTQTIWM